MTMSTLQHLYNTIKLCNYYLSNTQAYARLFNQHISSCLTMYYVTMEQTSNQMPCRAMPRPDPWTRRIKLDNKTRDNWLAKEPLDTELHLRRSNKVSTVETNNLDHVMAG
jgi:hypothetical protein